MIKITEQKTENIRFDTDMNISLANAIRRSINEIPILAVDSLEISKNDSALYDEIIAHRMGFIPLPNENLKLQEDCDCEGKGCGKCTIKLKLKAKGPSVVYSTDLSPKDSSVYKMPIALLDEDQELEFVAVARLGKGIEHAKFSPGVMFYRYSEDETKENLDKDEENFKKIVESSKKENTKELVVEIESWGQIKTKEIFIEAIKAIERNLKDLEKAIK